MNNNHKNQNRNETPKNGWYAAIISALVAGGLAYGASQFSLGELRADVNNNRELIKAQSEYGERLASIETTQRNIKNTLEDIKRSLDRLQNRGSDNFGSR